MPEQWMYDVMGDEARPRPGFEDQLARELHHEWRNRRTLWRPVAWGAAAAALLIGVVAVVAKDDTKQIAPADTTVPVSALPSTTAATETTMEATTATTATPTTTAPSTTVEPPTTGVRLYLWSLANGDYSTAAQLLNEGGLSLEDRADLRPLFRPEFGLVPGLTNRDAVAAALEKWCVVALCVQPTEVTDLADGRWTRAVFPTPNGSRTSLFTDYVWEGQTGVTGLPPMLSSTADSEPAIDCPIEQVTTVAWADLDGDGWIEQLVAQIGAPAGGEGGVATYTISTCGTSLQVDPFAISGDGLAIYPVSLGWIGPEYLLIGFLEGVPNGSIYALDGRSLVQQLGPGGPTRWAFAPPFAADPAETFGCAVTNDSQAPVLVNRTYRLIGGNELGNSTAMELTTVEAFTGSSTSTTFELPAQQAEAGEALIGNCNGLPVMTA